LAKDQSDDYSYNHTVTGMLSTSSNQFTDWSGAFRLFSKQRIYVSIIMNIMQSNVLQETDSLPYIIPNTDDIVTQLAPPFHANIIWRQRFIQTSLERT